MKIKFDGPVVKKVVGIVSAVAVGAVAVVNALSEQKKAQEFEEMKKTLSELTKQ